MYCTSCLSVNCVVISEGGLGSGAHCHLSLGVQLLCVPVSVFTFLVPLTSRWPDISGSFQPLPSITVHPYQPACLRATFHYNIKLLSFPTSARFLNFGRGLIDISLGRATCCCSIKLSELRRASKPSATHHPTGLNRYYLIFGKCKSDFREKPTDGSVICA